MPQEADEEPGPKNDLNYGRPFCFNTHSPYPYGSHMMDTCRRSYS